MEIKDIIEKICTHWSYWLKWFLDNSLFVKYWIWDKENEESDFFYFIEDNYDNFINKKSDEYNKSILELWKKTINKQILEEIKSFDKNLNLIIFVKLNEEQELNDKKIEEKFKKSIYEIEENPYYSNKFIIIYKQSQIENIQDIIHEINNINTHFQVIENEEKTFSFSKEKFIFDLITSLHFIKIDFIKNDDTQDEKKELNNIKDNKTLYEESFDLIDEDFLILLKKDIDVYSTLEKMLNDFSTEEISIYQEKLSNFEEKLFILWEKIIKDNSEYKTDNNLKDFINNSKKDE